MLCWPSTCLWFLLLLYSLYLDIWQLSRLDKSVCEGTCPELAEWVPHVNHGERRCTPPQHEIKINLLFITQPVTFFLFFLHYLVLLFPLLLCSRQWSIINGQQGDCGADSPYRCVGYWLIELIEIHHGNMPLNPLSTLTIYHPFALVPSILWE